jgi:chromosome partitioning protein
VPGPIELNERPPAPETDAQHDDRTAGDAAGDQGPLAGPASFTRAVNRPESPGFAGEFVSESRSDERPPDSEPAEADAAENISPAADFVAGTVDDSTQDDAVQDAHQVDEPEDPADDDVDADDVAHHEEAGSDPLPDQAPLKPRPLPRVIALANQKGGVGKTTTTINLGAALAEDDHRVLIIDLDPQGNATTGLGINSRALDFSIYDVLLAEVPLEDCVESTSVRNLFIAPASLDLAGAEIELVPAMSREMRLRNAISRVKDDYDYILIDCPPSLGLLTVNALAAADEVMVPIQCEYYALEGLGQLIRNINLVQKNLNTALELSAIILVMYDGRTKLAEQVSTEVREHFGNVVCRNVIPRNIRLSEAPSYGQPITSFDPSSRGAVAYRELAREVHRVSS